MTQQLRFDDGAGTDAATRGWGAAASASFKVRGTDWLAMQVTGGDGVGRYLNYIEGAIYDGVADEIRTERAIGVIAGYQHKPADWVRVNLVYGATRNFDSDYTDVAKATGLDSGRFGVNRYVQQLHLGPIFTPVKGVDLGVEGIWASGRRSRARRARTCASTSRQVLHQLTDARPPSGCPLACGASSATRGHAAGARRLMG